MLSNKALITALEYVRVLCQVPQSAEPEYALALYSELKDIYTDDSIMASARQICRNEKLYGVFPALATWLQYCPKVRAGKIADNTLTGKFMADIDAVILSEPLVFNLNESRKHIWETYGQRAATAVKEFGGIAGVRAAGYGATKTEQEKLRRQIKDAWMAAAMDVATGAAQIATQPAPNLLENKI